MAVNLFNEYPQNTQAPNEDYPFGAFRNRTAPEAADGTTLEEKWSNDWQAFFSRLFIEASMTPSGEVDTVKVSQYYDALLAIIQREKVEVSNALNGTRTDVAASEDALRRTHELASSKVSKEGDTMTGSLALQNTQPMLDLINSSIPENNVGSRVVLWNNAGNPTVTTTNRSWSGTAFNQVFPRKSGTIALTSDVSSKVSKSGDTMTGNLSILNNLPSLTLRNATIPENNRGAKVTLLNIGGRGTFSTSNESGTNEIKHTLPTRGGELALGNTASVAQNGWIRDEATGVITQWGLAIVNRANTPQRFKFPISFVNNCYNVVISSGVDVSGNAETMNLVRNSVDREGFTGIASDASEYFYQAIGK